MPHSLPTVNWWSSRTTAACVRAPGCRRLWRHRGHRFLRRRPAALREVGYAGVVSVEVLSADIRAMPPAVGARALAGALLETGRCDAPSHPRDQAPRASKVPRGSPGRMPSPTLNAGCDESSSGTLTRMSEHLVSALGGLIPD